MRRMPCRQLLPFLTLSVQLSLRSSSSDNALNEQNEHSHQGQSVHSVDESGKRCPGNCVSWLRYEAILRTKLHKIGDQSDKLPGH